MKRVLFIVPFERIYPPMNGGMQRSINLLHQLTKHFEVSVVINQDAESLLQASKEYPEIGNCEVLSTKNSKRVKDIFSLLPLRIAKSLRHRYWNRSLTGSAESNFLLMYPILKRLLKRKKFDYVILEELACLNMAKVIRRHQPKARIIYDAHNVNTILGQSELVNGHGSNKTVTMIERYETNLFKLVDEIFACSENDLSRLIKMNNGRIHGTVIPNGVRIRSDFSNGNNGINELDDDILFCGSLNYFPNQQGLTWFCKDVFPLLLREKPLARLMVVGMGAPGVELTNLLNHSSIIYYGKVEEVSAYYRKAVVAIVPLLSGSGTRLKILEAMGNRVAVVSTSVGAEGINCTDRENILIEDDSLSFSKALINALNKREATKKIADEAFLFVKREYDWNVIGRNLSTAIKADPIGIDKGKD